jgi:hypothetical protein
MEILTDVIVFGCSGFKYINGLSPLSYQTFEHQWFSVMVAQKHTAIKYLFPFSL